MKDIFKKLSIFIGIAALVTSSFESIKHFSGLINNHFWSIFFLSLLFSLIPLWPDPTKHPIGLTHDLNKKPNFLKKYRWVLFLSLGFLTLASYRIYKIYIPSGGPYPIVSPIPVTSEKQVFVFPFNKEEFSESQDMEVAPLNPMNLKEEDTTNYSTTQPDHGTDSNQLSPIIREFKLNNIKTSFIEKMASFPPSEPGQGIRTFRFDSEAYSTFMNPADNVYPNCMCGWESQEYEMTIAALQRYTELTNKQNLNHYFSTFPKLERLVRNHPTIAQRLIPKSEEWGQLNPNDFNTILRWVKCCIGIPYPTFLFSIQNPFDVELIIQSINFNVKEIDKIKPLEQGVFAPEATYVFELKYAQGIQTKNLAPSGFKIPSNTTKSFEIQLYTNEPDYGLCWLMNLEFVSNKGNCTTEDFQLIMAGKSKWSEGLLP